MKKALFVGVDDYKDPQIRNLSFSLADAFSLNAVFENLGYDTKVLANPTRLDLITAIRECNQSLKQGDSFFFYFAGHGWTTTGGVHLLFCSDDVYDPNGNFNAGVSFGGLKAETTGNGYNRAFVLDACRSHFLEGARDVVDNTTRDLRPIGELLEEDNQQNNAGSLAVIRSCSQNEHAIEIAAAQHGLFTLAMQSVMRGAIQEGRQLSFGTEFCSEITAEMRAFANKHKILNTQTPEFAMAGERQVLIPGRPRSNRENAPIYYSCPICGKNNLVTETFNCKKCSTEYLCLSHKSQELGICEKCYSTTVSQPPSAPRDINKVKCADIPDQILKKGLACPECHLFDEALDCALVKGKDYVVQYEDADSPGFAAVVITGIGEYCGEKRVQFEIKKEETPKPTPSPLKKIPCDQFEDSDRLSNGKLKQFSFPQFQDYEGIYDGKSHGIALSDDAGCDIPGFKCTWFNSSSGRWESELPQFVDVCEKRFTIKVTAPGYVDHAEFRFIKIAPKPLTLDMVKEVDVSVYADGEDGLVVPKIVLEDECPCVIRKKDWHIIETGLESDSIVVIGTGNYYGTILIPSDRKNGSGQTGSQVDHQDSPKLMRKRKWVKRLGWFGLSNVLLLSGWAIACFPVHETVCGAPEYIASAPYVDGACRTFMLPGNVEMEMVYVAPGRFEMGSDAGDDDEKPVHQVEITQGYWIGKYPVTQAQWKKLVEKNSVKFKEGEPDAMFEGGRDWTVWQSNTSDFPMDSISWDDCDTLVKALNSKETSSIRWMMPTEAQWEFAARGGNKSRGYKSSGSDAIDSSGWHIGNSGLRTHSVKEKRWIQSNELGIVGMCGNVYEWCRDAYYPGYYQTCKDNGIVKDPYNASGGNRVLRGGCWYCLAEDCRSAHRGSRDDPGYRCYGYGFRLCCSAGLREKVAERRENNKSTNAAPSGAGGMSTDVVIRKKTTEELVKEAYAAFVKKDWKTGFDIATNLSMNAISDSYVTYHVGYCHSPTYGSDYPKEKDYAKAYKWFKYTAELEEKSGDGIVQCILGDMEMNGQGCATNIDNAVAWYRISAERKYNRGCYELGKCYEDNIVADTNDNLVAATNWYFKAMELKYEKAKEAYERVLRKLKENAVPIVTDHKKDIKKIQLWEGGPYWADRNIGAEKPEDYGYYFWWGDTVGYKRVNDKWIASDGSNSNFSFDGGETTPTFGKSISYLQNQGWIIDKNGVNVLTPKYDAARAHWGGDWRMPTTQEFDDLKERCKWTWTTRNGVNGYVVQGKGSHTSAEIFLPCAGCGCDASLNAAGSYGYYWSSVPTSGSSYGAYGSYLSSSFHYTSCYYRYGGRSVRPLQGFTK